MVINPNIEPMSCYAGSIEGLRDGAYLNYVAQEKFDGHRAIMLVKDGKAHFYSRRNSDITGEKEDNTNKLHFFKSLNFESMLGKGEYIFDGELVLKFENSDSSKVQHLLGSTAERAFKLWYEDGYELVYKIFDVLKWDNRNLVLLPLKERLNYLNIFNKYLNKVTVPINIMVVPLYVNDTALLKYDFVKLSPSYTELLKDVYKNGGEGIILKDINSPYEHKRSKHWLKFKKVQTADLVIMGFVKPKKEYTGKFSVDELQLRGWEYWEGNEPVSKTYANGWVGGIKLGAYKNDKLKYVCTVKGFSDEVQNMIKNMDLSNVVVEVHFQDIINPKTKSLRHPRFSQFRYDKETKECLWDTIGNS